MTVKLTRHSSGYSALVTVIGSGMPAFELRVCRQRDVSGNPVGWMVESDIERFFKRLSDARVYINRFFEPANG